MQLKRFEARTIQEAIRDIKAELGEDAVIFSSRNIRPGKRGAGSAEATWVEVTAAVDRNRAQPVSSRAGCASKTGTAGRREKASEAATVKHQLKLCTEERGFSPGGQYSDWVCPYYQDLLSSGFRHDIAGYILGEVNAEYAAAGRSPSMQEILRDKIASHLEVDGPIDVSPGRRKAIAFIGPTGVGKTTTLAKIAARYSLVEGLKVKIITMDTYRIAAVEQLKIYCKIMGLPVYVATAAEDLEKEIESSSDDDLILIDTAGRNHRDNKQIAELGRWLYKNKEIEAHLLLSATNTESVVAGTIECFSRARVDRIMITKVDECGTIGHLYGILMSSKIPVSYFTTGQKVPEDICPASKKYISDFFLNGFSN